MRGPESFVRHLAAKQYHPRSDAHSNALCNAVLDDLLNECESIAGRARRGEIVASLNHTVTVNYQRWNIDLALGPPPGSLLAPEDDELIRRDVPTVIQLALEVKGVMTEHGKARRNRLRDLHAFHSHAHTYDRRVVAAGLVVVNFAPVFWSPLRPPNDITSHTNIHVIGEETIELYRNLPLRNQPSDDPGLEATCVLVVEHDNLRRNPDPPAGSPAVGETRLVRRPPAPQAGDPLSYATMIHRLCRAYRERWG